MRDDNLTDETIRELSWLFDFDQHFPQGGRNEEKKPGRWRVFCERIGKLFGFRKRRVPPLRDKSRRSSEGSERPGFLAELRSRGYSDLQIAELLSDQRAACTVRDADA
jgi:hypothetical protein